MAKSTAMLRFEISSESFPDSTSAELAQEILSTHRPEAIGLSLTFIC